MILTRIRSTFNFETVVVSTHSANVKSMKVSTLPVQLAAYLVSKCSFLDDFSTLMRLSAVYSGRIPYSVLVSATGSPSSELKVGSPPECLGPAVLARGETATPIVASLLHTGARSEAKQCRTYGFSVAQSRGIFQMYAFQLGVDRLTVNA